MCLGCSFPGCREGKVQGVSGSPHLSLLSRPVCPILALAGRRSLWASSPHCGEGWPLTLHCGEGNGNPLQCSCLENPRDGRAWWAAIYGVAQSWTRLKRLSSSSSNLTLSAAFEGSGPSVSPPLSLPIMYLWETGAKYPTLVKRTNVVWPLRTLHREWLQQQSCVVGEGGKGACWLGIHFKKNSFSSVQFSRSVMSNSLRPHELQHARPPCPSPTPGVHSNSRPLSRSCHPAISSSVVPFSSCPQSLPASESFPMSQLFAWGGQSTGVSALASLLPKKSRTDLL